MGARFTRCPVDIVFEFPYPINIQKIIIDPKADSHRVTSLTIFSSIKPFEGIIKKNPNNTQCCKVFMDDRGSCVSVHNNGFRESRPITGCSEYDEIPSSVFVRDFSSFQSVRCIQMTLFKSVTVPCMGSVKIVGEPSCKRDVLWSEYIEICRKICDDWESLKELKAKPKCGTIGFSGKLDVFSSFTGLAQSSGVKMKGRDEKYFCDLDAEFQKCLDPLTYEIMQNPVVLPSGHVLDKSTVVRHLKYSSTNPYTGLPMSIEDVEPNSAMRNTINKFILDNHSYVNSLRPNTTHGKPSGFENAFKGYGFQSGYSAKRKRCVSPLEGRAKASKRLPPVCSGGCCDGRLVFPVILQSCRHIFCRKCISNRAERVCPLCDKPYSPSDVERIHN